MKQKWFQFNKWIAIKITTSVGTMECAYLFALLAFWGGTGVDWHNSLQVVQWVSQTFLQLTLLSVIMIGSQLLGESTEKRAQEDHEKLIKQFEEIKDMHKDLHQLINVIKCYVEVIHEEQPKP